MFLQIAPKDLVYFCWQIYYKDLLEVHQSGHTEDDIDRERERQIKVGKYRSKRVSYSFS